MSGGALVVGEALIDEVIDVGGVRRHPGGSPANVALGLSRLGVATRLHTAIGADDEGALIREHLHASGVALTAESISEAPTSKAVAVLAEDGSATYDFAVSWNPRELVQLGEPRLIHTGSLGALLDPGSDVVRRIVDRGRRNGALIAFDPNIRPSLLPDASRARELFDAFAFSSRLTKLSDEDAEFLFPGEPLERVLDRLIDGGVAVAGITRGGEGASLASGTHRVHVPAVTTGVADTVGAGDSFMAALIHALVFAGTGWDGKPISAERLAEVGARAALAAAITVSRPGADLPTLDDLSATDKENGMTDKPRPTRRAVIQGAAAAATLASSTSYGFRPTP